MSGRTSAVNMLSVFWLLLLLLALPPFPAETSMNFHRREVKHQTWAPDCVLENITSINGQYPVPTIIAREGDSIVVQIENVVIRWQGIRKMGTHYGQQRSVVFYGSVIVDAAYKEPFTYNCQLSTYEQAEGLSSTQFLGEPQIDGKTAGHQKFSMMGTATINGAEGKRWTGQCKRVNLRGRLLKHQILPKKPEAHKGQDPHHN